MKARSSNHRLSLVIHLLFVVGAIAAIAVLMNGCDGGREGERCIPNLSHNDCGGGLTCMQPATCVESYCCPEDPTTSTNPFCNGQGCPAALDGGTDDAAGADAASATDGAGE